MIFSWWRRRRRSKILERPFPEEWRGHLRENFAQYTWLTPEEQGRLERAAQIFVAEKNWEGCNGLEVTDEIRITIAAQACMLLLGYEDVHFDRLLSVLIYPGTYMAPERVHNTGGLVIESSSFRLGEAWHEGPVILSWPSVLRGGRFPDDGQNVVYHEFAHMLDMLDHGVDGVPPLGAAEQYREWEEVVGREFEALRRRAEHGIRGVLDVYGATNEAEFFAVATEAFFERPLELRTKHAELYGVLQKFYRQDPAARVPATPRRSFAAHE